MANKVEKAWILKDWKVYPKLNLIQNHQSELLLKPRLMKLLEFFLLHQNQMVTKDKILDFVWEDRIVTENLLTKSISELRKILEERFPDQLVIETIRNVGYRLQTVQQIPFSNVPNTPNLATSKVLQRRLTLLIVVAVAVGITLFILAFISTEKATPQDYQITQERVTSLKGQELTPVVSPDGKNIAFGYREKVSGRFHIYVQSLQGNLPRKLSQSEADEFNPCWSPDGDFIVFMRSDSINGLQLIKKSIIGDDELVLTNLSSYNSGRDLLWLERENQLVFSAKASLAGPYSLYSYDLQLQKIVQMTHPRPQSFGDIHPTYSAETNQLAFIRVDASVLADSASVKGKSVLNVIGLSDQKTTPIIAFNHDIKELVYYPPLKQYLCWLSIELAENQLIAIDQKGKQTLLREVKNGMPSKGSVGTDGAFYYEMWTSDLNIHRYGIEFPFKLSENATPYLNSTLLDWGLRFAIQSDLMVFLSYRSGHKEVWAGSADAPASAYQITHFEDFTIQSASISPDGKQVAFLASKSGKTDIYTIQANGENLQKISEQGVSYTLPEWSNNNQYIYYGSNKSGQWSIWQKELSSGQETILQANGYAVLSPPVDHESLYYTSLNQDTIFCLNLSKRHSAPALYTSGMETGNWAIVDTGIYYLRWQTGTCHLFFYEFATQIHHDIRSLKTIVPGLPSLAVSPDNKYLFLAQAGEISADVMRLRIE